MFVLNELQLRKRYDEYDDMTFEYDGTCYWLLHCPYNVGDGWYPEAER